MMDIGVLRRLEGDERHFLNRNSSSGVLYDTHRPILAAMLNISRSVSAVEAVAQESIGKTVAERVATLIDDPIPATEDARNQSIRARLVRALVDDPILYFHDLNEEERTYLETHRGYLLRQIHEATGLIAEIRREGIAMVDDAGDLADLKLPEEGPDGHLALLLIQWLDECSRNGAGSAIPVLEVEEHVCGLIEIHGSRWRKEVGEAGALTEDALLRLRGLRLIQLTAGGVLPLAASGRYAAGDSGDSPDNEE